MSRIDVIKMEIEEKRIELNECFTKGEYQKYSVKSTELDKLIEEYIDLTENK